MKRFSVLFVAALLALCPALARDVEVYFDNVTGFDRVYAFTWNPLSLGEWPGTEVTAVKNVGAKDVYAVTVDDSAEGLIFNCGEGGTVGEVQTADIHRIIEGNVYNLWSTDDDPTGAAGLAAWLGNPTGLSGQLPVLYINVYADEAKTSLQDEIISADLAHKNYFEYADYWLDLNGVDWMPGAQSVGSKEEPLPLQIKARGNWTRTGFAKKPFKLKLDKKQSLLGMTKSKHYAILAHADDERGYLRNFTGFTLGRLMGLPWTPAQQPIEVVINGDYRGIYFLTESIRVGDDRIMISELKDGETDPKLCSGGYLVELDNYDEENQIRLDEQSCAPGYLLDVLRITWDTPEDYSDLQRRFVTDQFTAINNAIGANSDDTWKYLDLDDAARYYIVEELISHTESYHGSTYLFRDRGTDQKWHFSPLWDCGNAFSGPTDAFFYDAPLFGNTWIPSMCRNAKFMDKVRQTWGWFMQTQWDKIFTEIDAVCSHLGSPAEADWRRWHDVQQPHGGMGVADNRDIQARKEGVTGHLRAKAQWLKGQWGDYAAMPSLGEPSRDTTPCPPLPDYLEDEALGVVTLPAAAPGEATVYYDLTGIRVDAPAPGAILIERTPAATRKVRY